MFAVEYWKLGKNKDAKLVLATVTSPLKLTARKQGIEPEEFLPQTEKFLHDALDRWILGAEPFTARRQPRCAGILDIRPADAP